MLTFFRRIRKALLESGSTRKYLLYALGEIALVVIGILIALQINNWNEWRKDRLKESNILLQLQNNLETNCDQMRGWIRNNNNASKDGDVVIRHFENDLPYHDSLSTYFWKARLMWNDDLPTVGYEALRNEGYDILENDSLRQEILYLFEVRYRAYQNSQSWGEADRGFQEKAIDENFLSYVGKNNLGLRLIPHDPRNIMKNRYLHSLFVKYQRQRKFYNRTMNIYLKESENVLQLVRKELNEDAK